MTVGGLRSARESRNLRLKIAEYLIQQCDAANLRSDYRSPFCLTIGNIVQSHCSVVKKPERFIATRNPPYGCRVTFTNAAHDITSPDWATTRHVGEFESLGGVATNAT